MLDLLESTSTPIVWISTLVALGLILAKCRRKPSAPKLGWFLVLVGLVVLYLFSIAPVAKLLAYSLESRYALPSDQVLSTLDTVIILGAGITASGGLRDQPEPSGVTYARLVSGVRIFRRSGATTLVLSGGGPPDSAESEAGVMKALALELGVREDIIVTEEDSHNTMEQAVALADLLSVTEGTRIGLVTSALHMLRSERAFKKRFPKDTIVLIPVNYTYRPPRWEIKSVIPSVGSLMISSRAVHEWLGMIWYPIRY
jgi:uncharacterized SAM-binding protein YcdF (DUF218 family)